MSEHSANSQTPLYVLIGISALESLVLVVATGVLIVDLFIAQPTSFSSAIFLTAIVGGFAAALVVLTVGLWRGRTAARSASLVWQVLQMAIALGSDGGVFGIPLVALGIGIPAVTAIVLILFNPVVREHFSEGDEPPR